ncbi:MAG TPA: AraC family transcriptional regulator [Gemmatimonadaceae bacterium]
MSDSVGSGHMVSWESGFLMIGRSTAIVPMHAHYAIQIAFGERRGIRFRTSEREEWTEYDGALIASRQPHSMDATPTSAMIVLFVEPETREGRVLAERCGENGIVALSEEEIARVAAPLFAAWRQERSLAGVVSAAQAVINSLTDGVEPPVVSDERILRATAYIRSHLERPLTLEEVAEVACLSPSRFRHLFVEQTGMALRPYILWRRFLRVWELMTARESLSAAAHAAGFADAAHLTRTCRRMFGFPPSALQLSTPLRTGSNLTP